MCEMIFKFFRIFLPLSQGELRGGGGKFLYPSVASPSRGGIIGLVLLLTGCSLGYESQSLNDYFLSSKYVQEQNNYSIKNSPPGKRELEGVLPQGRQLSSWGQENFPKDCAWYDYERTVDGDTIVVNSGQLTENSGQLNKNNHLPSTIHHKPGEAIRVRMIGIDTPESKKPNTPIEPFALEASLALKQLLEGEAQVCLVDDAVGDKIDTYGRKLSYVFRADGLDVNAQMVRDGWAQAYTRFAMERKLEFEILERAAKAEKLGQWRDL